MTTQSATAGLVQIGGSITTSMRDLVFRALAYFSIILPPCVIVERAAFRLQSIKPPALKAGAAVAALALSVPVHAILFSARAEDTP